jgi:murein DD-endopeptidase MepM/ murein hydrolase activator NlpD
VRGRSLAVPGIATVFVLAFVLYEAALLRHPIVALRLLRAPAPAALPVPVEGVPTRAVVDSWGAPRGTDRTHEGIDIYAPLGTAVTSTTRGIVVTIGENGLGGNIVRVLGPGRQWHYYAHLDRFADIKTGEVVNAGDVLGYVGTTGNARGTSPHLHYGIYSFNGEAMNPYPLLVRRSS